MQMINLSKDEFYVILAKTYPARKAVYDSNIIEPSKKLILVNEIKMLSVLGTNYQENAVLMLIDALQREVKRK
ncbi:hypothetical protein K0M00_005577 [Escherichia coli]|uniref:hypothetical protein n=1 Tax=Escherichia coli TaxID=562 RepID=UPI000A2E1BA9|nr:hypothetical protein [Escherichia coli]WIL00582.1 hypothetical protein [Escherichia phage vB_EcoM_CRJP21]EKR8628439.1 hypothetical protein [Escherichia coli]ELQ3159097.1 hypothetical protein [Escherichia coli]OTE92293.1 hypothetical protein B1K96_15635 [Escherichia coli]